MSGMQCPKLKLTFFNEKIKLIFYINSYLHVCVYLNNTHLKDKIYNV